MCDGRLAQHPRPRGRVGMVFVSVEQLIPWKFPSLEANGEVRGKKEEGQEVERPSEHILQEPVTCPCVLSKVRTCVTRHLVIVTLGGL